MEIEQKKKILSFLINNVFIPQVNVKVNEFQKELRSVVNYQIEYKNITGYNIGVNKIIILDLKEPVENLLSNVLKVFNENEKS